MSKKLFSFLFIGIFVFLNSLPSFAGTFGENTKTFLKHSSAILCGVPGGGIIGGARGLYLGARDGTRVAAKAFGDEKGDAQQTFGFILGGVPVGFFGTFAGGIRGIGTGVKYGVLDPWTKKNFSLDEDFDYLN